MSELTADEGRLLSKITRNRDNNVRVAPGEYQTLLDVFCRSRIAYDQATPEHTSVTTSWRTWWVLPRFLQEVKPLLEKMVSGLSFEFHKGKTYPLTLPYAGRLDDANHPFKVFRSIGVLNNGFWDKRVKSSEIPVMALDWDSFTLPGTWSSVKQSISRAISGRVNCTHCAGRHIQDFPDGSIKSIVRKSHSVLYKVPCPSCRKELLVNTASLMVQNLALHSAPEHKKTHLDISISNNGLTAICHRTNSRNWHRGDNASVLFPSGEPMVSGLRNWTFSVRYLMYQGILEDAIARKLPIDVVPADGSTDE